MKRNIVSFCLFFVLALMLLSVSTMAQATNITTTDRIPVSGNFTACNGENVPFEGIRNVVIHFTTSSSGQVDIKAGISENVKGVGDLTGAKYVANLADEVSRHFDSIDLAPFNFTDAAHLNFNGQGKVPNTMVKLLLHFTINANGDTTSSKIEMTTECK